MAKEDKSGIEKENECQSCGCSQFETENGYKICTSCGQVKNNDIQLADDPMQCMVIDNNKLFANQAVGYGVRNELANTSTTSVQKMGIQMAETLALNYSLNNEMKNYLMNYYTKALNHKNFFKQSLKNKRILAAVCAYITLMNHNESIAIQYICSAVDCNGYEFGQLFNLFVTTFPESKPKAKPIEELVPSVLADFHITEEVSALQSRVIDIISIEKACWLVDGRSPLHLITAAIYLGWKSLKPKERAAIDFTVFCKTFGINYKKTTILRIKEMNDVFIKLAKFIPYVKWRRIRVHRNNVSFFIDDIIQYPNSLIFDLKNDVYSKFSQCDNNCKEQDSLWMKSFKRKLNSDDYDSKKTKEFEARKSRKNIKRKAEEKSDSETDISDTEISSYLRNETEIKIIKKLRKRAEKLDKKIQN